MCARVRVACCVSRADLLPECRQALELGWAGGRGGGAARGGHPRGEAPGVARAAAALREARAERRPLWRKGRDEATAPRSVKEEVAAGRLRLCLREGEERPVGGAAGSSISAAASLRRAHDAESETHAQARRSLDHGRRDAHNAAATATAAAAAAAAASVAASVREERPHRACGRGGTVARDKRNVHQLLLDAAVAKGEWEERRAAVERGRVAARRKSKQQRRGVVHPGPRRASARVKEQAHEL